jgi:hypothetical protein
MCRRQSRSATQRCRHNDDVFLGKWCLHVYRLEFTSLSSQLIICFTSQTTYQSTVCEQSMKGCLQMSQLYHILACDAASGSRCRRINKLPLSPRLMRSSSSKKVVSSLPLALSGAVTRMRPTAA